MIAAEIEKKMEALKLELPPVPEPVGSYRPVVIEGKLAFLSGQISKTGGGEILSGKLGQDLDLQQGQRAAQVAALNALSVLKHLVGFEKIDRILRVVGYVQTQPDFYDIPAVINGASDVLAQVLGDAGIHARSAVGMASLPLNAAVELELTVALR